MKFKLFLLLTLCFFLFENCKENTKKAPQTAAPETAATNANPENLVWAGNTDLVCEMSVDQTVEDTVHYKGKIYGFCGGHCKETFQENPAKYAGN